jgi:hypothetical protein
LKISNYYKILLDSWSFFLASQALYVKEDILDQNIFGNAKFSCIPLKLNEIKNKALPL